MFLRPSSTAVLALALLSLPLAASAAEPAALAQVQEELAGIEAPLSFDRIRAIPGGGEALRAIVEDPAQPVMTRAKAVVALQVFPTAETRALLTQLVADPKAPESLRTRAPIALVEGFRDEAMPALSPGLLDENRFVRKATAQAMAKLGTPAALEALKARRAVEPDAMVKKTLESLTAGR